MGKLPYYARGKKILDDIDGSENYERDSRMYKQRGLNVHKTNLDFLTDEAREAQIQRRVR
jgi:hypothetical protein